MRKVTKIFRKTASVMLASVMAGSTCYAPVMAATGTGTTQSFSLGRVGTILDSVKDLISGDDAIEKDTHKKADTFASKRLIVKADKLKNIDKKKVIASYDGYYLLKYKTQKEAKKAYDKYSAKANGKSAIAADQPVHMATGSADAGGLTNVTKKDNPLAELKDNVSDITKAEVKKAEKKKVIALLDTGASTSSNVIESVSMLGGSGKDDNGHGEAMVKAITKENKKAQIISIKVLDKNGEGSVSSIVSGIAYAEKRGASIVNLSLSGLATQGNAVVTTAVNDAIRKGMIVVGAAGNNGRDAANYIPGSIIDAVIVGAMYKDKTVLESSNYGSTVDAYAIANSTSEAAAMMSGFLSKGGKLSYLNKDFAHPYEVKNTNGKIMSESGKNAFTAQATPNAGWSAEDYYKEVTKDNTYKNSSKTLTDSRLWKNITRAKEIQGITEMYEKYKNYPYRASSLMPGHRENGVNPNWHDDGFQCGGWVGYCLWHTKLNTSKEKTLFKKTYAPDYYLACPWLRRAINEKLKIYAYKKIDDLLADGKAQKGDIIVSVNLKRGENKDDVGIVQHGDPHVTFFWGDNPHENKQMESGYIEWNTPRYHTGGWYWDGSNRTYKVGPFTGEPGVNVGDIHGKQKSYYFLIPWEDYNTPDYAYAEAKKTWHDGEHHSNRPASIKVTLQRKVSGGDWENVSDYTHVTLNSDNKWYKKTKELPAENKKGKKYSYKWIEDNVPTGYKLVSTTNKKGKTADGKTIYTFRTNLINSTTSSTSVKKEWVGYYGDDDHPAILDANGNLREVEVMFRLNAFNESLRGWKLKADGSGYDPNGTGAEYAGDGHLDWEYPVLNSSNDWSFTHTMPEHFSYTWTEYAWRYVGEGNNAWKLFENVSAPDWDLGPHSTIRTYTFTYQPIPNSSCTFTHDGDEWTGTNKMHKYVGSEVDKSFMQSTNKDPNSDDGNVFDVSAAVDNVKYQLYYTVGESDEEHAYADANGNPLIVDLNDSNGWKYSTGANALPAFSTKDSQVPKDDQDPEQYRYHYVWHEVPNSMTWHGLNVSGLFKDQDISDDTEEPADDETAGMFKTTGKNRLSDADLHTTAVDAKTGTKAGCVGSTGIIDNVKITNISPRLTYTLSAQLYKKDGNPFLVNGNPVTATLANFVPGTYSTFKAGDGSQPPTVEVPLRIDVNAKDLEGQDVVVYEALTVACTDGSAPVIASETDASDEGQTIHYPKIRTHMISNNPSKKYGHTTDGMAGDSDGKHFGTLQQSPNGTVSMTDTVTYSNLVNGTYTVEGILHRRGRTTSPGQDLGAVVVDGRPVTASATFTVSNANPVASGTVDVTYRFRFPESLYGGDYVSFETLKYNGIDLTSHAEISDGQQTVRMPTSFRILKREAKQPDKPIAGVTYQLFTKDEAGNLNPYKRDDGSDYILTTGADGTAEFRDLDIGKYWIKEIKVPEGVSLQAAPFEMNAGESRVIETRNENIDTPKLTTGGRGTTMYYVAAAAVAALCVAIYVIKKREHS